MYFGRKKISTLAILLSTNKNQEGFGRNHSRRTDHTTSKKEVHIQIFEHLKKCENQHDYRYFRKDFLLKIEYLISDLISWVCRFSRRHMAIWYVIQMFSRQSHIKCTSSGGHTTPKASSKLFCQTISFHSPKNASVKRAFFIKNRFLLIMWDSHSASNVFAKF